MTATASQVLDRVLVLEMVRITEAAAIAASTLVGRGGGKAADAAAVEAMLDALNSLYMDGTVVIGEGERDEVPMLLNAPDVYMDNIAVGPGYPEGIIDLDRTPTENVTAVAAAKGVSPREIISACTLPLTGRNAVGMIVTDLAVF